MAALIRRRPAVSGLLLILLVLLGVWGVKLVQVERSVDRASAYCDAFWRVLRRPPVADRLGLSAG